MFADLPNLLTDLAHRLWDRLRRLPLFPLREARPVVSLGWVPLED
jgi:hypothetical protein